MMAKKNLILDVDTGVDDAFALLFAARHPEINLLGVTCVDGNTNLKQVVINTLKVLDAAGAGAIPVSKGATRPLIDDSRYAEHIHGSDGLGDLGTPISTRALDPRPAVELIRDLIESSAEPVTLVPLGPLTNIALFLRSFPETAAKLERIVLMGGSASVGNATPAAEFNIWHDPEAAAIVFSSGVPITMYGLDVFMEPRVNAAQAAALIAEGNTCSRFAGQLIEHFIKQVGHDVTLGDYGAVASAIKPELSTYETFKVVVDTSFGPSRGQTLCDRRTWKDDGDATHANAPAVKVAMHVDAPAMIKLWLETISDK
jgi:pyrimidine-specific ribonucleoside hydrolase